MHVMPKNTTLYVCTCLVPTFPHTHTHTHTHTCIHMYTQSHIHTQTVTCTITHFACPHMHQLTHSTYLGYVGASLCQAMVDYCVVIGLSYVQGAVPMRTQSAFITQPTPKNLFCVFQYSHNADTTPNQPTSPPSPQPLLNLIICNDDYVTIPHFPYITKHTCTLQ